MLLPLTVLSDSFVSSLESAFVCLTPVLLEPRTVYLTDEHRHIGFIENGQVTWYSRRQTDCAQSSAEGEEIMALRLVFKILTSVVAL